jgi:hypothetical protein
LPCDLPPPMHAPTMVMLSTMRSLPPHQNSGDANNMLVNLQD